MITKLTKLFTEFFESEKTSGIILIFCTIISITITNSCIGKDYIDFWHNKIGFEIGGFGISYAILFLLQAFIENLL